MTESKWLSEEQLRELLDAYYASAHEEDEWSDHFQNVTQSARQDLFNISTLESLSDSELVERTLSIYRDIVRVPMYYKAITGNPERVRAALRYLLESEQSLEEKVNEVRQSDGDHYIKGLGKSFWSLFFMALDPDNNPYWNNKTEKGLEALGLANWEHKYTPGKVYVEVANAQQYLRSLHPRANLYDINHFMHFVTVLDGRKMLQEWKGDETKPKESVLTSPDVAQLVEQFRKERMSAERVAARQEAEGEAREILEGNIGQFDEETLREFFEYVNTDYRNGQPRHDRFVPAFTGALANAVVDQLEQFNDWSALLWHAGEDDVEELLDLFWEEKPITYAGTSLPTLILYLKDPMRYNIWLKPMARGLEYLTGLKTDREDGENYLRYTAEINDLRDTYNLQPQEMDGLLWKADQVASLTPVTESEDTAVPQKFNGFRPDTFQFLKDLKKNSNKEWFDENRSRYSRHLREPLRALFEDVAPVIAALDPNLETEAKYGKVLATINKRFADESGEYYSYLWGAFYRADRKKQTDAQLFIIVHPTHISAGLGTGNRAEDVIELFHTNVKNHPDQFMQLLLPLVSDGVDVTDAHQHGSEKRTPIPVATVDDWKKIIQAERINIERTWGLDDEILYRPELASEIATLFEQLYPLHRFFVSESIEEEVPDFHRIEEEPPAYVEVEEERYSFADLETETLLPTQSLHLIETLLRDKRQIILYGPPGTGKTYLAKKFARYFVDQKGGETRVVQFHPSYSYEEFIEGIRPEPGEQLTYPVKSGIFLQFCKEARQNRSERYVMIIDEINRGSLPRIFGELLYLLEYRGTEERIVLPYSGDRFSIPPNVYLIGTMNTADRSIALVDHALRRRFYFIEQRPNSSLLRSWLEANGKETLAWVADLLENVNHRLSQDQIGWHLHVGHTHFMRDPETLDEERVELIWHHAIQPMLDEYFYNRPDKLAHYDYDSLKAQVVPAEQ